MTPGNSGSPLLLTEETAADQSVVARLLVWLRPLLEQGIQPRYSATTTEQHSLDHPFIGLPPDRSALVEDESGATYRADTVSIQPPPPPPTPRLVAVVSYEYLLQATVELPDIGIDLTADLRWYSRPTQSRIVEVTLNGNPLNVTPQDEEAVLRCVTEYYQRHKNQSSSDAMRLLKSLLAQ